MNTTANTTVEKFTPGPWGIDRINGRPFLINAGKGLPKSIIVEFALEASPNDEANAKLIAAAPDLFAACKEFVRKVEAGEAKSSKSYEQMKAAIKKATE